MHNYQVIILARVLSAKNYNNLNSCINSYIIFSVNNNIIAANNIIQGVNNSL